MYKRFEWNKRVLAKVILLMIPHFVALMGLVDLFPSEGEESHWSTETALLLFFGGLFVFILACLWLHDEEMKKFMFGDDEIKSKTHIVAGWAVALFLIEILVIAPAFAVLALIGCGVYWLFS